MPVIVIGADSPNGAAVVDALLPRQGEVRVFVTDEGAARDLRGRGAKVAVGDVSDGSHVAGAALNAFCAVVMADAAADDRIRSFADDPAGVLDAWAEGISDAGVRRVIFVPGSEVRDPGLSLLSAAPEFAAVATSTGAPSVPEQVATLDDAICV